jgi:hypothetical protein
MALFYGSICCLLSRFLGGFVLLLQPLIVSAKTDQTACKVLVILPANCPEGLFRSLFQNDPTGI